VTACASPVLARRKSRLPKVGVLAPLRLSSARKAERTVESPAGRRSVRAREMSAARDGRATLALELDDADGRTGRAGGADVVVVVAVRSCVWSVAARVGERAGQQFRNGDGALEREGRTDFALEVGDALLVRALDSFLPA